MATQRVAGRWVGNRERWDLPHKQAQHRRHAAQHTPAAPGVHAPCPRVTLRPGSLHRRRQRTHPRKHGGDVGSLRVVQAVPRRLEAVQPLRPLQGQVDAQVGKKGLSLCLVPLQDPREGGTSPA